MRFFRRVHSVLASGGEFILEPQAWDTYGKAKRMDEVNLVYFSLHVSTLTQRCPDAERERKEFEATSR